MTSLTDRQLRFVFEYIQDYNASAAAVRAGYSEKSRASAANELMNNPAVQERLRMEIQELLAELKCSALALLKERMRAAFFRAEKMLNGTWEMRELDQIEPETRAALEVSSVMRKSGPVLKVKQPDRDRALRALEKVHERLDRLNERYWARLEREGKVMSLEEIEAMDAVEEVQAADAPVARDFSGKPMDFLGYRAEGEAKANAFSSKTIVFSGLASVVEAATEQVPKDFSTKPMDFLGSSRTREPLPRPQASPWLLREAALA